MSLPKTNLSRDAWFKLTLEQQVEVLVEHGRGWVLAYFECAIRHNVGSDAYQDAVDARNQWIEDRKEPDVKPEKD